VQISKRLVNKFTEKKAPYRGTVLSFNSLGMEDVEEESKKKSARATGWYVRNGVKIFKLKAMNRAAALRYPEVVVEPLEKWWPSKYASFILSRQIDAMWAFRSVPEEWNPSLWKSRKKFFTVRLPKDLKKKGERLFSSQGLWYSKTTNVWKKRHNFELWQNRLVVKENG
jgi:hypothetical protein